MTLPEEDDHPGPTRHILCDGMANVQLGPDPSQRTVRAADGTELSLLGQNMLLTRPDGSRLQVALSGGKVVFLAEGDMEQQEKTKNADGASLRSRRSRLPSVRGSQEDARSRAGEQSVRGSQEGDRDGAMTARTAQSDTRSVKSHKTSKSETQGAGADGWGPGAFVMSLVTGSFHTEDLTGAAPYAVVHMQGRAARWRGLLRRGA